MPTRQLNTRHHAFFVSSRRTYLAPHERLGHLARQTALDEFDGFCYDQEARMREYFDAAIKRVRDMHLARVDDGADAEHESVYNMIQGV